MEKILKIELGASTIAIGVLIALLLLVSTIFFLRFKLLMKKEEEKKEKKFREFIKSSLDFSEKEMREFEEKRDNNPDYLK